MANGKSSARRREVRRSVPRPDPRWLHYLRQRRVAWAVLFATTFAVVGGLIAAILGGPPPHYLGQVVTAPIVARVKFKAEDKAETLRNRRRAHDSQPNIYAHDQQYLKHLREQFAALIAISDYESLDQVPDEYRKQVKLTDAGLARLQEHVENGEPILVWQGLTRRFLRELFSLAVLSEDEYKATKSFSRIIIVHPDPARGDLVKEERWSNVLYSVEDEAKLRDELAQPAIHFPPELRETVLALVFRELRPTYRFDPEATDQARDEAFTNTDTVLIHYNADDVLFPVGRELSASDDLDLLEDEQRAFAAQQGTAHRVLTWSGQAGVVLLIAAGLWVYIFAFNEKIIHNPTRGLAITALLLLCQFLAVTLCQLQPQFIYGFATFPTLMAAIVLAIVYDRRFAGAIAAFHTVFVMLSLDLPIGFGLVMLTGAGTAMMMLRDVRTRSTLLQIGLWSGMAMGAAAFLTSVAGRNLYIDGELKRIIYDTLWVVLTGLFTGMFVQAALPTIEMLFKVSTAMTLRELNDASHPLLQRLAQEAPGTYQHSLRIADMAEAAAEAIGADALLCRVGAMYHDIGKINKPAYFIENQGGGPNRHSKLSPAMSRLIIVGHVKDGTEMAREYGLPQVLLHFIESHHGTTLVEFFYHAAKRQKEAEAAEAPSEFEFRYPGPKPQTKEAAILLLCDSIEATARTLAEPTPVRIEQLVGAMANKRLMDGQFNESNLTLQELHKIDQSITKTLCAVYHSRVKYPADGEDPIPATKSEDGSSQARPVAS